jgi:hypothetical protein
VFPPSAATACAAAALARSFKSTGATCAVRSSTHFFWSPVSMADAPTQETGRLVADALRGAWRMDAAPLDLSEAELKRLAPPLQSSGAGALVWWRLKSSSLAGTETAEGFRQSYLHQTLRAAVAEESVGRAFRALRRAGVDAMLVKGLVAARAYPEAGLRPFGDIDLCVRHGERERARRALASAEGAPLWVDLHEGWEEVDEGDFEELFERGETLRIAGEQVHIPAWDDHLRLLCLHFLRHGAWRPLWLCDIAASLEARTRESFDWTRVVGKDEKRARWVECAVGLSARLLGARVEETPFERAAERLPRWLAPEVLKQWATPFAFMQAPMRYRAPMRKYLKRPRGVFQDLLRRWPNPIEATVHTGGPFNELPRWPFQLANCLTRTTRFLAGTSDAATH